MPLNDNGFVMPDDDDILSYEKQQMKDQFGNDIDTSPGSVFGRLCMYNAQNLKYTDQKGQQTYDGANPMTATGVQLDRLAANAGIQRNTAQYAEVQLVITGHPGYVIQEDTPFETNNGDVFTTIGDNQIPDAPQGKKLGTVTVDAMSQEPSASENVGANTITNQSEPVDDITSVNNPQPASDGADLETDYDLRHRIRQNLIAKPGPQPEGLRTALLNINGVTGVHMQNNTSGNQYDSFGNPPHSIHFYISGGDPNSIFSALANNAAYGTTFVCDKDTKDKHAVNTSHEDNYDIDGSKFHLAYDDAEPQDIYFRIGIVTGNNYDSDAVKQSINDYLTDFEMGTEVIINKLYSYLYGLDGVNQVTQLLASPDNKHWTTNSIKLRDFQIARVNNDDTDILIDPVNVKNNPNAHIFNNLNISNNEIDLSGSDTND